MAVQHVPEDTTMPVFPPLPEPTTMSLHDLQRDYAPLICDGSWEHTTRMLLHEEYDILEELQQDLQHGRFREPVILDRDQRIVLDGTHRIVAAALSHEQDIDVVFEYPHTPTIALFVDVVWHDVEPQSDDIDDALFTRVRSFRLHDTLWAESSSMSGALGYDGTTVAYTFPQSFSVAECEQFQQVLTDRLAAFMDEHAVQGSFELGVRCDWTDYTVEA